MTVMIQDLVDVARIEARQIAVTAEPLDLSAFVRGWLERMAGLPDVRRIQVSLPEHVPLVVADADRLERILTNIVSNALKYSPPDAPVSLKVARSGSEVVTSVSDSGQGIPSDTLPHLFERYYRTRHAQ